MSIILSKQFKEDLVKLKKENPKNLTKILELIVDIDDNVSTPINGIGKPEKLIGNLKGFYSRRITQKHRIIYTYRQSEVLLVSCFGHYK